ncbi:MAG TPA: FkbM family methyltransferase [Rhizomicrobium sp.]|nr:FkbM family methyltransferase [Rhizomicrobium sp.]
MSPFLKYRLKKALGALGIRPNGAQPARSSLEQFCRHLRSLGFEPQTIIDVGVADGTFDIYTVFPDARYLLIEPMAEFRPALDWICAHYKAEAILAAVSAEDGEKTIRFGSSMADMHGASLINLNSNIEEETNARIVPVRRLERLVRERNLPSPMMIKIDVQGAELDVIRGAEDILTQVDVIILETALFDFETSQPLIADSINFMSERGFVPYDIFAAFNRPLDNALGWCDIAYVQRHGIFRKDQRFRDHSLPPTIGQRLVGSARRLLNI